MTLTPRTYASEEAQIGFASLPESDQTALKTIHQAEAEALNMVMNTRASTIMEDAGVKTPEVAKETTTGVIDRGTYLEVNGWKVSKENLWAPTLPAGEIEINAKKASRTVPQVWSYLIDENAVSTDKKYRGFELWKRMFPWHGALSEKEATKQWLYPVTLWEYNYEGVKKEIEHRGEYCPSREELLQMVNSVSGNCIEKAKALNIPFAGCRGAGGSGFVNEGGVGYLWSSSPVGGGGAQFVYFRRDGDVADDGWHDHRGHGFPARSFLDKKRV